MTHAVEEIATIVVCEDDTATLDLLCDHLTADRFEVLPAPSAADALRLCRYNHPDLMILDLTLPDASGLDILREIRQADGISARYDAELPIIVLSASDGDTERVRVFEEGADDFLVMPAPYEELRARIRAALRRTRDHSAGPIRVGDLRVDPSRWKVVVGERDVRLTKKEFRLLLLLAADPTRVFSKDGETFVVPSSRSEPSSEIERLKGRRSSSRADRAAESYASRQIADRWAPTTDVRPEEIEGYGSTARCA